MKSRKWSFGRWFSFRNQVILSASNPFNVGWKPQVSQPFFVGGVATPLYLQVLGCASCVAHASSAEQGLGLSKECGECAQSRRRGRWWKMGIPGRWFLVQLNNNNNNNNNNNKNKGGCRKSHWCCDGSRIDYHFSKELHHFHFEIVLQLVRWELQFFFRGDLL